MDIRIYKEFYNLAQTKNFRKTAQNMYTTQSTLSKHIQALEKELGTQLFLRDTNHVELTSEGNAILPDVLKIIRAHDRVLFTLNREKNLEQGILRIGYFKGAVTNTLKSSIHRFNKVYPNIKVILKEYNMMDIFSELHDDRIDIGVSIIIKGMYPYYDTEFIPLQNDYLSAVVPANHQLANEETVFFHQLLAYPLILPAASEYAQLHRQIQKYINQSPNKPNIICDYIDIQTNLLMIEAGLGISILPSAVSHSDAVRFIPMIDCQLDLKVGLLYKKKNNTTGLREYINLAVVD